MENRMELETPGPAHAAAKVKATACCGHHDFEKATEVLSNEHRLIERVLAVVEKLAAAPVAGSLDGWKQALDFFSHFADQCHHFKEEQVLFPAMAEGGIPRDGGPIGMMLTEHEDGRDLVRLMRAATALMETKNEVAKKILSIRQRPTFGS
jgi:hemerythrin-like domain-containing protein